MELVRHEDSWPFMKLVSRTQVHARDRNYLSVLLRLVLTCLSTCAQVPDYYDIIKKPIALSTIREKVNNCEYQTAGEETDCR